MSWACNALNHTATTTNPGSKSRYEMCYGPLPLAGEVWPFLKPAMYTTKRENKSQPKAQECYYVGPSVNHPRDCMRVLTTHRTILTTRNVTWKHVFSAPPAPQLHLPPIAEEGESTAGRARQVKARRREGGRLGQRVRPRQDGDGAHPTRNAQGASGRSGAGTVGVTEGNPPAPSAPSRRAESGSVNDSSNSKDDSTSRRGSDSNANHTSNDSSSASGRASSGDIPALLGAEARRLQHFDKPPELQSGRTRSQ